ncbi:hypothetical protein BVG16_30270 [Paenibacillus selenitireducens]|uniref:KOW domain-containing protein n=1 Tax=Paenibacillus selenitireducens TaxID=1324314 RepID=A0A1T2WZZ9_9BACL|nr:KOW domain-containing RNA-binding protein [Paenibacillus selenitireducens]OPA73151.1 hypothetical protein BVG16_30270 [Paenibacillus selenitireducens]
MNNNQNPQIGQFVQIIRGRDAGQYAVIVGIVDSKFVLLADGDKRKFDQPKKKNLIHLQLQPTISSEVVNSLDESGRVTNGKLRFAISKFIETTAIHVEKGE